MRRREKERGTKGERLSLLLAIREVNSGNLLFASGFAECPDLQFARPLQVETLSTRARVTQGEREKERTPKVELN